MKTTRPVSIWHILILCLTVNTVGCARAFNTPGSGSVMSEELSSTGGGSTTGSGNSSPPTGGTPPVVNGSPKTCAGDETLYANLCYKNTRACAIQNGSGVQAFSNGAYGACVVGGCNYGYFAQTKNNSCYPLERTCYVANGSGQEYWTGSAWSGCYVQTCASGFALDDNLTCHRANATAITVSSKEVYPGSSIEATWNGGPNAYQCVIYLTNVAYTDYNPYGLLPSSGTVRMDNISSNTKLKLICVDTSGAYTSAYPATTSVNIINDPKNQAIHKYMANLNIHRNALYNRPTGEWEVWYDGVGSPVDGQTTPYFWDNPIDDDWNEPYVVNYGFAFNYPSAGYWHVDRAADPTQQHKGGVISRRDEYLHSSYGITIEFRAKIFPDSGIYNGSDHDAFSLVYQREDGITAAMFISPSRLQAGGYNSPARHGIASAVPFNATDFNTYRLVQYPNQNVFYVYVNGSATPIMTGTATSEKVGSVTDLTTPTVIIGGEGVYRSHFILDYVRYRRGAFTPGQAMPPVMKRLAPFLPQPLPLWNTEGWNAAGFDSKYFYSDPYAIFGPLTQKSYNGKAYNIGCTSGWVKAADNSMEYGKAGAYPTCIVPQVPGLYGQGDYTVEARIKVLNDHGTRGFSIMLSDELGTQGLVFSKDKVEMTMGIKNIGYQAYMMNTTDGYHKYRVVRRAGQMYAHLYVDDWPIPLIVDQRGDASTGMAVTAQDVLMEFGYAWNPGPGLGHVQIDYIRWAQTAYAPPLP